jgi:hypothetical protein
MTSSSELTKSHREEDWFRLAWGKRNGYLYFDGKIGNVRIPMNEWIMVGTVVAGTVVLLGGGGWIASLARGRRRDDK